MYNVVTYLGPVPVLWTPYYRRNLTGGRGGGWAVMPGFSSRLGAFVVSTYHYWFDDAGLLQGETSINGYSKRGVGVGQNVLWGGREGQGFRGNLDGFFISDSQLYRSEQEQAEREDTLTESERYRLRLRHTASVTSRDALFADGTYLSDPYVQEDFFRRENRRRVQPENRASWTHRGDAYIFSLQANGRLNDFYSNVNRLPEATLTIPSLRLGNSPLYYESRTTASALTRVYPETSDDEEYDATRVDTLHTVYLPRRFFGFLALTPRAGWRGTHYSTTYAPAVSVTNQVTTVDSNGVSTVTDEITTTRDELGADFRNLYEIGFETSYKAYKVLHEGETVWGRGLRHVVEPYANYSYIPEPDLLAESLPQFDSVDGLAGQNAVQFGFRHKFQTRRPTLLFVDHSVNRTDDPVARNAEGMDQTELGEIATADQWSVHDLVNADIGTIFQLDPEVDEEEFGPLYANARFWPSRSFRFDFKSRFDLYGEGMTFFDGQLSYSPRGGAFQFNANYLFQNDRRDLIASQIQFNPRGKWSFGAYARYDMLDSRLEEHSYFLRRKMDCIGWGIGIVHEPGYDGREDEVTAWAQLWLLAMPYLTANLGG
ncbi:MAG: LPS-assembly protein LptD [Lentisphaerae bacterium]|nr:LPS-assembly protein LptD [Lentisphaerota bacterium]